MLNTIVEEKSISFKELENCQCGCDMTKIILEDYEKELEAGRDKKVYRNKGKRKTTIKTVFGEVEYTRNVYRHLGHWLWNFKGFFGIEVEDI